ncbi:MAG: high-potential iron-sulfur protein [Steroidobacteraceae bacterium]
MSDKISRRTVLMRGLQLPVGGVFLFGLSGCGAGKDGTTASGKVCADPATLSDAEMSTRTSLGYTEKSPNPQQVCAGCTFFHAGAASGDCGTCDMVSGGPVNPQGHCNSWNAKAA